MSMEKTAKTLGDWRTIWTGILGTAVVCGSAAVWAGDTRWFQITDAKEAIEKVRSDSAATSQSIREEAEKERKEMKENSEKNFKELEEAIKKVAENQQKQEALEIKMEYMQRDIKKMEEKQEKSFDEIKDLLRNKP